MLFFINTNLHTFITHSKNSKDWIDCLGSL